MTGRQTVSFGILLPTRGILFGPDIKRGCLELFRLARAAEDLGYHSLWVGDSVLAKPRLEALTVLSALAATTERVRLGTSVLLSSLRQPVQLAHALATIDVIANGRLIVGIGVGRGTPDIEAEFKGVGIPFKERSRRLEEGVELMRLLWWGEPVTYRGRYVQIEEVTLAPRPVQSPGPPVWIASNDVESGLRRVARLGDGWITNLRSPHLFKDCRDRILGYASHEGRDGTGIVPCLYVTVNVDRDPRRAIEEGSLFLSRYYGRPFEAVARSLLCCLGSPEVVASTIEEYISVGASVITVRFASWDQSGQLELFSTDVVPRLR